MQEHQQVQMSRNLVEPKEHPCVVSFPSAFLCHHSASLTSLHFLPCIPFLFPLTFPHCNTHTRTHACTHSHTHARTHTHTFLSSTITTLSYISGALCKLLLFLISVLIVLSLCLYLYCDFVSDPVCETSYQTARTYFNRTLELIGF